MILFSSGSLPNRPLLKILNFVTKLIRQQIQYMNLIFIHGKDTYRSYQRLKEISLKHSDVVVIDEDNFDIEKLQRPLLSGGSLFSKNQLVIVKRLLKKYPNQALEEQILEILGALEKISSSDTIVFYEESADKRRKLYKKISAMAKTEEYNFLEGYDITNWIKKYVQEKNGKIYSGACDLLVAFVGNNLWRMASEIDKLLAYKNFGEITAEDVELLVTAKLDTNIFNLVDAVAHKNKRKAFTLLRDQLESGAEALYVLVMLVRQFRILTLVSDALKKNPRASKQELALTLKFHPFVCEKARRQAQGFSEAKLRFIYEFLCRIDVRAKTSRIEPRVLLDMFLAEAVR